MTLDDLRDYGGLCYVATPYSLYKYGLNPAANDAARHAAHIAVNYGLHVFSPVAHGHQLSEHGGIPHRDHQFWMRQNAVMMQLAASCVVVRLEGWQESRGVAEELEYFQAAGKPIVEMDPLP